jgi:hypothetical protein
VCAMDTTLEILKFSETTWEMSSVGAGRLTSMSGSQSSGADGKAAQAPHVMNSSASYSLSSSVTQSKLLVSGSATGRKLIDQPSAEYKTDDEETSVDESNENNVRMNSDVNDYVTKLKDVVSARSGKSGGNHARSSSDPKSFKLSSRQSSDEDGTVEERNSKMNVLKQHKKKKSISKKGFTPRGSSPDPDSGWVVRGESLKDANSGSLGQMLDGNGGGGGEKKKEVESNTANSSEESKQTMKRLTAVDVGESSKALIVEWETIGHVDLIHRQGLSPPPLVFETVRDPTRPYFRMFLPQASANQKESCIYCRRKRKEDVYRFSLDPNKLTKRKNPAYVGSMVIDAEDSTRLMVYNKAETLVADIRVSSTTFKKNVTVFLLNEYLNLYEKGAAGRVFTGIVNAYIQPMLALKVERSERVILQILNPTDVADPTAVSQPNRYIVEIDYPLTILLSFAIVCAVEIKTGTGTGSIKRY